MKFILINCCILLICVSFNGEVKCLKMEEKFLWQELEFAWPTEKAKLDAIDSGRYIIENNLPLGLDVWRNKLFITVPRWKAGVPASLNYALISDDKSPILFPYPSWEANTLPDDAITESVSESIGGRVNAPKAKKSEEGLRDNSTILSVFRIRVDECDRLWVMDTGLPDILGDPKQIAPPALVIFDLNTDRLIRRYTFTEADIKEDSFFANVIVDVHSTNCNDAFAYAPDLGAYGVIVYSFRENRSWRVKHNYFHFDPINGDYSVGGVKFQWTDGVFGMAVGKTLQDGSRDIFFHALSSTKEFKVNNRVLQNETRSTGSDAYYDFQLVGDRGPRGQSSAEFYDEKSNVLFYTQVNKDGVGCWNTQKAYTPDTQGLVDSDSDALVFPNDLKVDRENNLWVLSDRMPQFLFGELNKNEFNYRILKSDVQKIIQGTPCEN